MVKYRNIRIKKPGGGTRLQRARVLASGKLKFVKNKKRARPKLAARVRGKIPVGKNAPRRPKSRSRKSSKSRGGNRTSKQKPTLPVGLLVPGGLGTYAWGHEIYNAAKAKNWKAAFFRSVKYAIGVDIPNKSFNIYDAYLLLGWGSGGLIHKGIGKYAGVNKALGQAHVPIFRV